MKKSVFLIFALILVTTLSCSKENKGFKSVSVEEFTEIIKDSANVIILDVRTIEEYANGHIEKSINIDVKQDNFEETAKNRLTKDKTIALYCRSGKRSKKAAEILTQNGYKVVELSSGYSSWQNQQQVKR